MTTKQTFSKQLKSKKTERPCVVELCSPVAGSMLGRNHRGRLHVKGVSYETC